jgi:hypothetical protein
MRGIRDRRRCGAALGAAGLLALLLSAPASPADAPLRYRFDVGDRLVYERRVQVAALEGASVPQRYTEQLQLWCLKREQREALILAEITRVMDDKAGPSRGAPFHVDRRGQRRFTNEVLVRIGELDALFEVLPILPATLETDPTWLSGPDHFGRRWRCTRRSGNSPNKKGVRVDFVLADPTGVPEVLGQAQRGSYWFDPQAGIVRRMESEWTDRSTNQRIATVTRLHAQLRQDPVWCLQRLAEVERFLRTLRLEDRLLDQATTEPERIEQILPHIERLWTELAIELSGKHQSPIRRLAQTRRSFVSTTANRYREQAELAARWLDTTAAHWSLQTPDGDTIRSETMRDRIVVECFWSASSLWSLRSFELLRQLQEQLPADKFRVICLNVDADVAAARRAARSCGTGLTHVLAGPPVGGEPPRELPVFRVVDQESRILRVYFGWQPTLAEKIAPIPR